MYSMKDTCLKVGLSYQTLKFYCNSGLIPNVKRDENNYRVFDDRDVDWITNLLCLKRCGMSLEDIKTYVDLIVIGQPTVQQRKQMLQKTREDLLKQIELLESNVEYIDKKQQFYDDVLSGKIEYMTNINKADH